MGLHGPFGPRGHFGRGRARRGDVRTAILQLLNEEPRNGYQIISELAERSGGAWRPSPGAVYPALNQLEDEGLIETFDNEGSRAFRLTSTGREAPEVHADTAKIWDDWTDEGSERVDARIIWRTIGEMSMALKAVVMSGDATLVTKAEAILAETKRSLYGLLASAPDEESTTAE
jgi:DNA-binding PadR family transcriptional regulator